MARYTVDFYSKSLLRRFKIQVIIPSLNLAGTMQNKDEEYYQNRKDKFPLMICLNGFGDNEDALLKAAICYKNINNLKESINHFEHLLETNSLKFEECCDDYFDSLSTYISQIDNHELAINYIDTFLKYDENNVSMYLLKVNELILLEKCDEAYIVCDKILSIDKNNIDAHFNKSKISFYKENYIETIKLCDDYLKLDSNEKIKNYKSVSCVFGTLKQIPPEIPHHLRDSL